ncbi:MAG TPA: MBL fold metallo-hydrolase [Gammaproteobacteria bacterium]
MDGVSVLHHGATRGVTGSCHELRIGEAGLLVDCGLFQGVENAAAGNGDPRIDFPVAHLRALVLTHVHIDHCGRLPHLWAAGFDGPVYCSEPSAILLPLVLEDALKVGVSRDARLLREAQARLRRSLRPLAYGTWHALDRLPLSIRLQPAGHILGSAYVECRVRPLPGRQGSESAEPTSTPLTRSLPPPTPGRPFSVLFSGDLGPPHTPLLPAPKPPYGADVVVLESTYGDRDHDDRRTRRQRLQAVIELALRDRGAVLVPAFSIGRTQELLYELEGIIHAARERPATRGLPWQELDIVVDSPLAARFTRAYRKLRPFWDAEAKRRVRAGRHPLAFAQLTTIDDHAQHLRLVELLRKTARPCVVLAAGGMCQGGRIVNHLKALLGDPRTNVLFVGYQAQGTPGRAIQQYGPQGGWVELDGERITVRAGIHTVGGYSAHAGQRDLVRFVRRMRHPPRQVRLVHGDPEAKRALQRELDGLELPIEIVIPS